MKFNLVEDPTVSVTYLRDVGRRMTLGYIFANPNKPDEFFGIIYGAVASVLVGPKPSKETVMEEMGFCIENSLSYEEIIARLDKQYLGNGVMFIPDDLSKSATSMVWHGRYVGNIRPFGQTHFRIVLAGEDYGEITLGVVSNEELAKMIAGGIDFDEPISTITSRFKLKYGKW
ncbi:hypothetical protein A3K34_03790 [candidate division WWE3 bacterium RIFOXYC1_FULL_40_10]|uniref:Uncharacterized protein n=1 Tax=candidate division WWE3 bacterium RIFOXYA2_FULL_46_9 TaxID=1802636 RepID=A0A1F4W1X8_UNCKA|nr:MAG: hypothetical protein A3K58_03790 [candidate division WWE3 bacterium RIFOXYB1_FULL_40_22]OGC61963.1 MAG: hypothetical protein A3K37_03790 [candidate division WWE3 bacterium RIFOXYA1_FULL_40_11]OGC63053.1 MAG: hypothetical protein A2264_03895 [candidate division WWE3 bacterium RIFOXYA2_FULL_46_9]OGC64520.1 MAG: hypothetical protein A2326_03930 [candidate division WWE3 bacterium RIFOXYB2_FULL_41_6]OGC66346.1 MAG: hypothetical protein A3K34_03790 [candidate division WWE3 bacterium RIFOXYC1_